MNDRFLTNEELQRAIDEEVKRLKAELIAKGELGGSWNCPKCNFNNAAGWPTCDFCWTPKPKK
jgi:hypothetical protein